MSKLSSVFICLLSFTTLVGCATSSPTTKQNPNPPPPTATQQGPTIAANGYALLDDLMGDEKNVSILRFIKHERPALKTLLIEIAATNRAAHKQLQEFAKADASLNIKDKGLPVAETATRSAIADFKQKAILGSKGKDLEIQLLLSQNEALTYGSHLARVLADSEPNPERRKFLQTLASSLARLQRTVVTLLQSNYSPPGS